MDSLLQEKIRDNHCAQQAQINHNTVKKIRERTDPTHPLYP